MKKKKVWSSISRVVIALMFISSWVALGISFALTSVSVKLSGGISFTATGIYAEISGEIAGATDTLSGKVLKVDAETTNFDTENAEALEAWNNLDLAFGSSDITITITITNKSTENGINVTFTDNLDKDKSGNTIDNLIVKRNGSETPLSTLTVDKSASEESPTEATITITLRVDDRNKSINYSDNWEGLSMTLTSSAVKDVNDEEYSVFTFSDFDASAQTCSIAKNASNLPTGALEIPAEVRKDGVVYNVTKIGQNGFSSCTGITSVTLPSTMEILGGNVFYNCQRLATVNLNDGLKTISYNAVYGTVVTRICIPASVISLEGAVFANCPQLTSIEVMAGNEKYSSYENGIYEGTNLIAGCKSTVIKDGTTVIGGDAFNGSQIQSITIPSSVVIFQARAFANCTSLTSITIPAKTNYIGIKVFDGCTLLTSATFETPTGWSADGTTITEDLSDPETAATCLKTKTSVWTRN